ncbi:MAG TPA: uracil phosphoribosyltransferase, partial [Xanthomonadales bacterium]|nr:uracil phosphoribosyltransferase [Xanthomonadales bacterium]
MPVATHILGEKRSLFGQFLAEIRDVSIQQDRLRFRRNLERIGEVFALEISRVLDYKTVAVETPLGTANCQVLEEQPVVASILRAGLPLHQGLLNYFDRAENT